MAFKVLVSLSHECELHSLYTLLNREFKVYCSNYFDFFIFTSTITDNEYNIIKDSLYPENTENNEDYFFGTTIIFPCNGENKSHLMHFYNDISNHFGIIFDYPQITSDGEVYLYHCLDSDIHSQLLKYLEMHCIYTIQSIIKYPVEQYYQNYMFSLPDLAKLMTRREQEILSEAYFKGYYDIPRKIKSQEIATHQGTSRYNIDKIIRNAEKKVMEFIYPFLI